MEQLLKSCYREILTATQATGLVLAFAVVAEAGALILTALVQLAGVIF